MYDIGEIKIGDIMICGNMSHRQFFYVHNIKRRILEMSGICEDDDTIFTKDTDWTVDRKANAEEATLFYDLIERYGFKFNINTGVAR